MSYGNTITIGAGKTALIKPPAGAQAEAWDALRALRPELDGARVGDFGRGINVQVERAMGTVAARTAIVEAVAEAFRSPVETSRSSASGSPATITWTVLAYRGEEFCVETTDCSCHPDGDQS